MYLVREIFVSDFQGSGVVRSSEQIFGNDSMRNYQNSKFKISRNILLKHLLCVLWTSCSVTVISTLSQKIIEQGLRKYSSTKISQSNKQHFSIVRMPLSSKQVFCHLTVHNSRSIYNATAKLHINLSMTFQQCQNIVYCFC